MDPMASCNRLIDGFLSGIRNVLTAQLFERTEALINGLARIAAPVCALVGAAIFIVLAIKTDSLILFFSAFGWVFLVILLYYIGSKLQSTCESTVRNNSFSVASQELIDTFIALHCVVALVCFFAGFYLSIKTGYVNPLVFGAIGALVTIYFLWILLHPHLVTTYVEPAASAGLDAISYVSLGNKMFLRANKLLFGLLPTIAAVLMVRMLVKVFGDPGEIIVGGIEGAVGFLLLAAGLLSPLVAYLIFLFSYLVLDVMRSILLMGAAVERNAGGSRSPGGRESDPENAAAAQGEDPPKGDVGPSPTALRNIGIGLVIALVLIGGGTKMQEYYEEYQERAEVRRAEEAERKAEEEERQSREAEERAQAEAEMRRISAFVAEVRKYVGKPALDLVLEPEVNRRFRKIFGTNLAAYENYFSDSAIVVETGGLILGQGCLKATCSANKALVVVDTNTGDVYTAVINGGTAKYFGIPEENVSPLVKKWVMTNKQ